MLILNMHKYDTKPATSSLISHYHTNACHQYPSYSKRERIFRFLRISKICKLIIP